MCLSFTFKQTSEVVLTKTWLVEIYISWNAWAVHEPWANLSRGCLRQNASSLWSRYISSAMFHDLWVKCNQKLGISDVRSVKMMQLLKTEFTDTFGCLCSSSHSDSWQTLVVIWIVSFLPFRTENTGISEAFGSVRKTPTLFKTRLRLQEFLVKWFWLDRFP